MREESQRSRSRRKTLGARRENQPRDKLNQREASARTTTPTCCLLYFIAEEYE